MKARNKIVITTSLLSFLLTGCNILGDLGSKTYTITWENYDGTILEKDEKVKKGSTPTYDGAKPTKPDDSEHTYNWNGWDPSITQVTKDQTYKATYTSAPITSGEAWKIAHGVIPSVSEDGKTVTYGLYPQTNVNDESLINELDKLTETESNGWYLYKNEYYAKTVANIVASSAAFDNGIVIANGLEYWFKCEPIKWNIIDPNTKLCLSSVLLESMCYYNGHTTRTIEGQTIYPNNYKYSDIRSWLTGDFYSSAFALNNSSISEVTIDNSAATTMKDTNPYACESTRDKVFLPSYQDYISERYGFTDDNVISNARMCRPTDWARARGSRYYQAYPYEFNGYYFTRSPDYSINTRVCYVDRTSYIFDNVDSDQVGFSVRPALYLNYQSK